MRKMSEIIGLKIVEIERGLEVGTIKSVIFNQKKGKINFFATEKGFSLQKGKVISTEDILGIGDYAVTINTKSNIKDINKVNHAIELAHEPELVGKKVITNKGRLVGEIIDFFVDENKECLISKVQISSNAENRSLSVEVKDILTYGKNLMIVAEDGEQILDIEIPSQNVSDLFDYKRKQFVKGKKCSIDILKNDGTILLKKDQIIDDQIYENIKNSNKIFELIKNLSDLQVAKSYALINSNDDDRLMDKGVEQ